MTNLVLRLEEGNKNLLFMQAVLKLLVVEEIDYSILSRPQHSYALESIDGLVEIKKCEAWLFEQVETFIETYQATVKLLWIDENTMPTSCHYLEGVKQTKEVQWEQGLLPKEVYYYGPMLCVHYGEDPSFIDSEDYKIFDRLTDKYSFLKHDYDDQTVCGENWFCIPQQQKNKFIEDFKMMNQHLSKYDIKIQRAVLGIDADLNVERVLIDNTDLTYHVHMI